MDLKKIIQEINEENKTIVFSFTDSLEDMENFLIKKYPSCKYLDHGCSVLCFILKSEVIKICKKVDKTISETGKIFKHTIDTFIQNKIEVLPVNIIYENKEYLLYTQNFCNTVEGTKINHKFCRDILCILKKILLNQLEIPDLYYKNFGYYMNKLYLFDCNSYTPISVNNELVCMFQSLYSLFSLLFYKSEIEIDLSTYGKFKFPPEFSSLLKSLMESNDSSEYIENIDKCIFYLEIQNNKTINQYQYLSIISYELYLYNHTFKKYKLVEKIIQDFIDEKKFSYLDAGCCIGGIGLKIAEKYPTCFVTLNNITESEMTMAENIGKSLNLYNYTLDCNNIMIYEGRHTISSYFALFHHILKSSSFDDIIKLIKKQTQKYAIIELPVKGDALLENVIKDVKDPWTTSYKYLTSEATLKKYLSSHFKVIESVCIDYDTSHLKRYAMILKL